MGISQFRGNFSVYFSYPSNQHQDTAEPNLIFSVYKIMGKLTVNQNA